MVNNNPVCEDAKETQMYRTVFWTLWERERGMIWENGIKTCIISPPHESSWASGSAVSIISATLPLVDLHRTVQLQLL